MPVQTRADPAIMVNRTATERAGRPSGTDQGCGVCRQRLHLRQARFEMPGRRLVAFLDELDQRDLEPLLVLAVGDRHEADAPGWTDWLLEGHVGQGRCWRDRYPAEDFLQAFSERAQLLLLDREADQRAAGAHLQVKRALSRLADGARRNPGNALQVEAVRGQGNYFAAPRSKKCGPWGKYGPLNGGEESLVQ